MRAIRILLLLFAATRCVGCGGGPAPADLILVGGRIVTLEAGGDVAALAARDGRVVTLGTEEDVRRLEGPSTRVVELEGRLAVPGFIEGHGHFTGIGASLVNLDLRDARSWDEVVERVERAAATTPPGEWILGWGWHQDEWDRPVEPSVQGYPTHRRLSAAVPEHPVLLKHAAGAHAGLLNAAGMARAGIDRATADPPGGEILRDKQGDATGVLRETAYRLALGAWERDRARRSAAEVEAEELRKIELATRECLRNGVTSFQDAGSDLATIARLRKVAEAGDLGIRLWVMVMATPEISREDLAEVRLIDGAGHHLSVRAVKLVADGALGSHGAWLLEAYSDRPESTGIPTHTIEELETFATRARDARFQVCTHAIGDRANREVLDLYERVAGARELRDLRWRIEHAQHLSPADVPRFGELGVIASMQTVHCTSDASWVPNRLGEARAAEGAYLWRALLDTGAVVTNGTDAPIEDVDPIRNFHAAVTRRAPGSDTPFHPGQRLTRREALEAATLHAAWSAFEENDKGSLAPGKLADVTVLSHDILTVPDEEILDARVDYTIVGGHVAFERGS